MSKIKDIHIQLQLFSISLLTNGNVARCKIGIVEMQLLRAVDLVICHKTRWIESVKIVAKQRAQTAVIANDRLVSVKLNGENWIELPDLRLVDNNINEIQKALQKQATILYRLLHRYGLERVLLPSDNTPLDWKSVSFTDLKTDLLAFMNSQTSPIPFHFFKYPRNESIFKPETNSKSCNSLFSKLEKLKAIFAAYSIRSPNQSPVLASPFTPLVHYNGTMKRR